MDSYEPASGMRMQTVLVTLQNGRFKKDMEVRIGGNCNGFGVMESAVDSAYDKLLGDNEIAEVTLTDPEGGELELEDAFEEGEEWLKQLCVRVEIIGIDLPKRSAGSALPAGDSDAR